VRTTDQKLIVYPQAGVTQLFDVKRGAGRRTIFRPGRSLRRWSATFWGGCGGSRELEDDLPAVRGGFKSCW